jgi:hypothetical protein
MKEDEGAFAKVSTVGIIVVMAAMGGVLYLKSIGIRSFGPVPTLIIPMALFVVRAWWTANISPERMRKQQKMMAGMITAVCTGVMIMLMIPN